MLCAREYPPSQSPGITQPDPLLDTAASWVLPLLLLLFIASHRIHLIVKQLLDKLALLSLTITVLIVFVAKHIIVLIASADPSIMW